MITIVNDDEKRKKACDSLIKHIENDNNFDMGAWSVFNEFCGTVRCIGGWTEYLIETGEIEGFPLNEEISQQNLLFFLTGKEGVSDDDEEPGNLFFPYVRGKYWGSFTKEEALKTLRHLRKTGVVNWDL